MIPAAASFYLQGNHERVSELLAPLWKETTDHVPSLWRSQMAALEGDLDSALGYYSRALSESDVFAFVSIHSQSFVGRLFPEYRSSPKYQKMLRDVGLDEESVAKLEIPPLPF